MAKSAAERVQAYLTRKRQRAREAGLCITCCKEPPRNGRSTCGSCSQSASHRTMKRRIALRHRAKFQQVIEAREEAGDIAQQHHFHSGAILHYRGALALATMAHDRTRISGKIAHTLYLGSTPTDGRHLLDDTLSQYTASQMQGVKVAELLIERARQLWTEHRMKDALPDLRRAIEIAKAAGDLPLYKSANLTMISYLFNLNRWDEIRSFFEAIGEMHKSEDGEIRNNFFTQRALMATVQGRAKDAYADLEQAIQIDIDQADTERASRTWMVWGNYGWAALALGDTLLAKSHLERGLLIVRQKQITWSIPYKCLVYADILRKMGHYSIAHHYVREALSYETPATAVQFAAAEVGIPLALEVKDDEALGKCASPHLIEQAFASCLPFDIGPIAAAFARLYFSQGKLKEASTLLHRALEKVLNFEQSWDLFLEIARYGTLEDIPKARAIIEKRTALPCSNVAHACLKLFNAFVAHRSHRTSEAYVSAREAARCFGALHWNAYVDIAHSLLPEAERQASTVVKQETLVSDIGMRLTQREHEIVALVLKGLTNRAIAEQLSLKERTIESHMTSIMSRLGIRSRYQLGTMLPD